MVLYRKELLREVKIVNDSLKSLYGVICKADEQIAQGEIKEAFVQIGDALKNEPDWKPRVAEAARNAENYFGNGAKVTVVGSAGNYAYW